MGKENMTAVVPGQAGSKIHAKLLERVLQISQKRRGYLEAMREAVRLGDKEAVFELARTLTGLTDEERTRTD